MSPALLVAALLCPPAGGAQTASVRRERLTVPVKTWGTVIADDAFRLKSTIEGRIEKIATASGTWRGPEEPLALIAPREVAAMIDSAGAQDPKILQERWQTVYKPSAIRCSADCYVLNVYARPRTWVKPATALFDAAGTLKLVGRVLPEVAHLVEDGQRLLFWPAADPSRRLEARVARFRLDKPNERNDAGRPVASAATFTVHLDRRNTLEPGTAWEGEVLVDLKRRGHLVPTAAVIRHGGSSYVAVRVSTGVTTPELTEVREGIASDEVLVLDDAALKGLPRHRAQPDPEARERRLRREAAEDARRDAPPPRRDGEPEYEGEDPYAE